MRRSWPGLAGAALFLISLALPAIVLNHHKDGGSLWAERYSGYECLMFGWIVIPAWAANPLLLVAGIARLLAWRITAMLFAGAAVVAALSTIVILWPELELPHVGYFAWLASMVLVLVDAYRIPTAKPAR